MITHTTNLTLHVNFPTTIGECSGCQSKKKKLLINEVNFFKQLLHGWLAKENFKNF